MCNPVPFCPESPHTVLSVNMNCRKIKCFILFLQRISPVFLQILSFNVSTLAVSH